MTNKLYLLVFSFIVIACCDLLTITFITLKLIDKIDWSWGWILSPFLIPATIIIGFFGSRYLKDD